MNEILVTLRLIAELSQGVEQVAGIMSEQGRDLTDEEVNTLRSRVDASTSGWLAELERLRNAD